MPPAPVPSLPIDAVLPEVVAALRRHNAVVVQAPPGAGKTTRLPPALLDAGLVGDGQLLLLEPRRVAARAAAATMARQRGEALGATIGFQVRFEKKASASTRILVVTEGILTRRFAGDAMLDGISVVVLDEFHERSIHTDVCLALLKELLSVRDDLKVVVMSATLDAGGVAAFLNDCPIVTSEGRPFPVVVRHVEKKPRDDERPLEDKMVGAIRTLLAARNDGDRGFVDDGGDVLCFLPGTGEIFRTQERLSKEAFAADVDVVPLYGALSPAEQDRALNRGARRRIILATNVAETSLTIEGVTAVVDSGLMKSVRWDSRSDRERLELVRISKASAEQRAGRAGRTRPGRALRLWTEVEHTTLQTQHAPEIHRVELSRVLLDIALFSGVDPRTFGYFEPPPAAHVDHAVELLQLLGALDAAGKPTAHASTLARLPLSPRSASVQVAAARYDVVEDAALAMALLEDDRALQLLLPRTAATATDSDLQTLIERASHDRRLHEVQQTTRELIRLSPRVDVDPAVQNDGPGRRLKRAVLAGFPDRVCRRRRAGEADAAMVGGRGVKQLSESGVHEPLFLALSLEGKGAAAGVRVAEGIDEALLRAVFPTQVTVVDEAVLDEERGAFVGVRRTRFADLILDERSGVPVDDTALAAGLAVAFAQRFERLFAPSDEALALLTRLRFAARALPDEGWPVVDDAALKAMLPALCTELVSRGKRRLEDVANLNWFAIIERELGFKHKTLLDDEVPARLTVPTGNALKVDYAPALDGGSPALAVRLQECFGWLDTPRVAKGKVPVVLQLLSPGYKPVQVTTDLRSFWQRGYVDVKKELKARYPKHSWPDDPLAAAPVAKGRSTRG